MAQYRGLRCDEAGWALRPDAFQPPLLESVRADYSRTDAAEHHRTNPAGKFKFRCECTGGDECDVHLNYYGL